MRRPDWETRFAAVVDGARVRTFGWGTFDCCTFAADVVQAVTGRDPMATLRGYSTWRQAARLVRRLGGLKHAVRQALGEPMPTLALAQRGDVVLVRGEQAPALGVVIGASALVPLPNGVQRVPMGDWLAAWKVD